MKVPDPADTIAAISTPVGEGGIGLVRLSGPAAEAIGRRLFRPLTPRTRWQSHRLYLGHLLDAEGAVVDEVLLTLMRAPRTYTREDVVEINCHSGYGVLKRILELCLEAGARLAKPGEFTLRAFLAGRIDLTQAEAVRELIQARTELQVAVAAAQLQGGLGYKLREVRENLLDTIARVEAALDFPEEAGELAPGPLTAAVVEQIAILTKLADTYTEGRLLTEGLLVVIAGRPNAGKSSLLNRLLNLERAIVTDIPGTTRDLVEETVTLSGILVRLSDTAGLGPARDRVEEIGMARTKERLEQADLILYVVDGSIPLAQEDTAALAGFAGKRVIVVINKSDLPARLTAQDLTGEAALPVVAISALTGAGMEALRQEMAARVLSGGIKAQETIIVEARQQQHLIQALDYLTQARELLDGTPAWELVALELAEAGRELGEITGESAGEAVLDRIFSQFCLGK